MKISTKGRYALRLMLDIAVHSENGVQVPIAAIAHRQSLSEKYLEQIITMLMRAEFVKSVRGAQGGYLLSRTVDKYTVGDILRVTEGSLSPVSCAKCAGTETCPRADECVTIGIWRRLDEAIAGVVDQITLADLVAEYHEKHTSEQICPCS